MFHMMMCVCVSRERLPVCVPAAVCSEGGGQDRCPRGLRGTGGPCNRHSDGGGQHLPEDHGAALSPSQERPGRGERGVLTYN